MISFVLDYFHMNYTSILAVIGLPLFGAIVAGSLLLKRAVSRNNTLPEDFALAFAWTFVVGSLVWLEVFLRGSTLLGFGSPWTWLAAVHFAFAGFGALTVTSLCCRVVADSRMRMVLRILLVLHPIAYLVIAAGISGYRHCNELGSSCYLLMFAAQFFAVLLGNPEQISGLPRFLLYTALAVPIVTIVPALAWAWEIPIFDLSGMVRYHGIGNAVGHVGLGLTAFGLNWYRCRRLMISGIK